MSMKVSTRQVDGVTILDLSGRITLGEGSVTLRDSVRDVLAKGPRHILLNLGDISYIDSSGIGELVSAFTSVKNAGGELKLLNLTKKVHDLLQITKLYTVFDIKDDESHYCSRCLYRGVALAPQDRRPPHCAAAFVRNLNLLQGKYHLRRGHYRGVVRLVVPRPGNGSRRSWQTGSFRNCWIATYVVLEAPAL